MLLTITQLLTVSRTLIQLHLYSLMSIKVLNPSTVRLG